MARPDRSRVRAAQLAGAVAGLRDVVKLDRDLERQARHRAEWPELWERLDDLMAVVERSDG